MSRKHYEIIGVKKDGEQAHLTASLSSIPSFCGGRILHAVYTHGGTPMDYGQWPARPRKIDGKAKPGSALLKTIFTDLLKKQGLRFGTCWLADHKDGDIDKYLFKDLKPFTIKLARSTIKVVPHMSDWYVNYNHGDRHKVRHCVLIFSKVEKKK